MTYQYPNLNKVKIVVRIRPINLNTEIKESIIKIENETNMQIFKDYHYQSMTFDQIVNSEHSNQDLQDSLDGVIDDFSSGTRSCTIFAYGQTGAGKTFTITGENATSKLGILQLGMGRILDYMESIKNEIEFELVCSFFEIYNDRIYDLLNKSTNSNTRFDIQETSKGEVYVNGLTEVAISSQAEALEQTNHCLSQRSIKSTQCNLTSSRSHCIYSLTLLQRQIGSNAISMTKCRFVDLAGSEKIPKIFHKNSQEQPNSGMETNRLQELIGINKSLTALGHCINSLSANHSWIPWRNCKLTRILKDSIQSEGCRVIMIIAISPSKSSDMETLSSLQFAERLKKVKLDNYSIKEEKKVMDPNPDTINKLIEELNHERKIRLDLEDRIEVMNEENSDKLKLLKDLDKKMQMNDLYQNGMEYLLNQCQNKLSSRDYSNIVNQLANITNNNINFDNINTHSNAHSNSHSNQKNYENSPLNSQSKKPHNNIFSPLNSKMNNNKIKREIDATPSTKDSIVDINELDNILQQHRMAFDTNHLPDDQIHKDRYQSDNQISSVHSDGPVNDESSLQNDSIRIQIDNLSQREKYGKDASEIGRNFNIGNNNNKLSPTASKSPANKQDKDGRTFGNLHEIRKDVINKNNLVNNNCSIEQGLDLPSSPNRNISTSSNRYNTDLNESSGTIKQLNSLCQELVVDLAKIKDKIKLKYDNVNENNEIQYYNNRFDNKSKSERDIRNQNSNTQSKLHKNYALENNNPMNKFNSDHKFKNGMDASIKFPNETCNFQITNSRIKSASTPRVTCKNDQYLKFMRNRGGRSVSSDLTGTHSIPNNSRYSKFVRDKVKDHKEKEKEKESHMDSFNSKSSKSKMQQLITKK